MKDAHGLTEPIHLKKMLAGLMILLTIVVGSTAIAGDQPAPQTIPEGLSCGVCGMYPAKFVKWQTQVIFKDGTMVPFDGGKDMFKYILDMAKYDKTHNSEDIAAIWVRDFNNGAWVDGHKAVYVIGSKVMGPMGKEIIPFMAADSAEEFKAANMGMTKQFQTISLEDIQNLGGMGGMKGHGMGMGSGGM